MDIHKPKPWHGWREFGKELTTIVLGVLIALVAEQAVEWLHHRTEVAEARHALDAEVRYDLAAFDFSLTQAWPRKGRPKKHNGLTARDAVRPEV
jgi:hypothetical protein